MFTREHVEIVIGILIIATFVSVLAAPRGPRPGASA